MSLFNEPELLLLHKWTDACLVEQAMNSVREKYSEKIDTALAEFQKDQGDFDYAERRYFSKYGNVAIAKNTWFYKRDTWPSGFWIEGLRLENLTSQDHEHPSKWITIHDPRVDREEATRRLRKSAKELLSSDEFNKSECDFAKNNAWLGCPLEQSREELFGLLIKDESRGFIDCLIDHFEWMARFASVVDEILLSTRRSGR